MTGTVDITNMSISIVDNFFSSFVRDEVLLDHLDCVRSSSIQSFSDWFSCQPTSAVGQLANFNFIDLPAFVNNIHSQLNTILS